MFRYDFIRDYLIVNKCKVGRQGKDKVERQVEEECRILVRRLLGHKKKRWELGSRKECNLL